MEEEEETAAPVELDAPQEVAEKASEDGNSSNQEKEVEAEV